MCVTNGVKQHFGASAPSLRLLKSGLEIETNVQHCMTTLLAKAKHTRHCCYEDITQYNLMHVIA